MRTLVARLGLVGVLLLATPSLAEAQAPSQDSVAGTGDVFIEVPRDPLPPGVFHLFGFNFSATSGPAGENPTGQVSSLTFGERFGFEEFTGTVTCVVVSGNRAAIGATGSSSLGAPAVALMTVVDGGPANSGLDTFNAVRQIVFPPPAPPPTLDCSTASFSDQHTVTSGDVVVHDAQPFPTSKDQCKNNGWRNFPGFKNQGDCVSFVATHGKHAPG